MVLLEIVYIITILALKMSIKKDNIFYLLCFSVFITHTGITFSADESTYDPVLEYYTQRSAAVFKSTSPILTGTSFSFIGTTYYKSIGRKGAVEKLDSASIKYFYNYGQLDSSQVIYKTADKFDNLDFTVPNIFELDYDRYFFPNDTGGAQLAIGFDADTSVHDVPVGLSLIDRKTHQLRWLYLFYPDREKYKRYSRSFRFIEHEGRVFPDSIWEVGDRLGIFSTDSYRTETRIDSIQVIQN